MERQMISSYTIIRKIIHLFLQIIQCWPLTLLAQTLFATSKALLSSFKKAYPFWLLLPCIYYFLGTKGANQYEMIQLASVMNCWSTKISLELCLLLGACQGIQLALHAAHSYLSGHNHSSKNQKLEQKYLSLRLSCNMCFSADWYNLPEILAKSLGNEAFSGCLLFQRDLARSSIFP